MTKFMTKTYDQNFSLIPKNKHNPNQKFNYVDAHTSNCTPIYFDAHTPNHTTVYIETHTPNPMDACT